MTGDTPPTPAMPEPEPIPDPTQPGSAWRITQIVAAPPGWRTLSGSPTSRKTIRRDVAVWALLEDRVTGQQTIRGYVEEPAPTGALVDAKAEVVQGGREWFGYGFADPSSPDEDED